MDALPGTSRRLALATLSALLPLGWLVDPADAPAAAPPAQASPALVKPTTPVAPVPMKSSMYQELAPGLLARTRFATAGAGPVAVEIVDLLVAPHQLTEIDTTQFGALLEIEAGNARLLLDGKAVVTHLGTVVAVSQGQRIGIDNRQAERTWVARLVKLTRSVK